MSFLRKHKTTLLWVGLGGWLFYWLVINPNRHECADFPVWAEWVLYGTVGATFLFMFYLMWGMRGFPKKLYRYQEADREAIGEARRLLQDYAVYVGDPAMDEFLTVAEQLPTFTQ